MATPAMELRNITTGYGGYPVLSEASLILEPGTATGLLGRNGSGKTTLIHTALGLKAADSGSALLFGEQAWDAPPAIRARVGFMPQVFWAYEWLSAEDALSLVGDCYPHWDHEYVKAQLDKWLPNAWEPISTLSPGQRQRVAALLALGHKPDLLMLDEPVAAMDPGARREFFDVLADIREQQEQTVLLSSHITSDIKRFCTHVAIMQNGKVLLHEPIVELLQSVNWLRPADAPPEASKFEIARLNDQVWLRDAPVDLLRKHNAQPADLEDLVLALTQ